MSMRKGLQEREAFQWVEDALDADELEAELDVTPCCQSATQEATGAWPVLPSAPLSNCCGYVLQGIPRRWIPFWPPLKGIHKVSLKVIHKVPFFRLVWIE